MWTLGGMFKLARSSQGNDDERGDAGWGDSEFWGKGGCAGAVSI
jgi:hypothetical protein